MSKTSKPPFAPPNVWVVLRPNGEKHIVDKEPLEGIYAWARGQNLTIIQYDFATTICVAKPEVPK